MTPEFIAQFIADSYADADAGYIQQMGRSPRRVILPKRYTLTFAGAANTGLAAGGAQTLPLQIQANGDFILVRTSFLAATSPTAAAAVTNALVPVPQWRVQITDSGTDEQYANAPVDLSNFAANAGGLNWTRDECYPRIITGSSSLNIQMVSYETAAAYSVDFVLTGVLVKTYG